MLPFLVALIHHCSAGEPLAHRHHAHPLLTR
jgi:hypothetical protein